MKKLTNKVRILEAKSLRKLHKKSASDHARQAAKFREDSLKLGCHLAQAGENPYKSGTDHPVYAELILPLLQQAAQIGAKYGFNCLFQVQTPIEGMPEFTHCIGNMNSETVSPTMKACVELIEKRPLIGRKGDDLITKARTEPLLKSDTDASE